MNNIQIFKKDTSVNFGNAHIGNYLLKQEGIILRTHIDGDNITYDIGYFNKDNIYTVITLSESQFDVDGNAQSKKIEIGYK